MERFPMKFVDGHVVVSMNKFDYIIDTGSPISFGNGNRIIINEKRFPINKSSLGMTADSLNSLSGLQIDGLIGMDILIHFDIQFTDNEAIFSDTPIIHQLRVIKLPIIETITGIPIVSLNIEGKDQRIFFDTGAKISYLSDDLLVGTSVGQLEDFHPLAGKYQTNVYKINVKINKQTHQLTFGSLPLLLRHSLTLDNTKGIIGTELFQLYRITISNLTQTLLLEPLDQHRNYVREISLD